jgi:hypothetical protein
LRGRSSALNETKEVAVSVGVVILDGDEVAILAAVVDDIVAYGYFMKLMV